MKYVDFTQANQYVFKGKDVPPKPVYQYASEARAEHQVTCWQFSLIERFKLLLGGKLFVIGECNIVNTDEEPFCNKEPERIVLPVKVKISFDISEQY